VAIHRTGNALVCVGSFLASGAAATGLTVNVDVYEIGLASGSPTLIVNSGSATEIARGLYYYRLASGDVDLNALYVFVFYTSGTADQKVIAQGWAAGMAWTENLDAATSSRASQASVDTVDDFLDTEVGAIKAKTDQFTFTTANKVDATIQAAGDFAQAAADKVWLSAARTLTSFGTLVADVASAVWSAGSRTLTSFGTLIADIWTNATRTLTSFGTLVDEIETALSGVTVTITGPVINAGTLELVPGDAYDIDHSRSVNIAIAGAPTYAGATVKLVIGRVLSITATDVLNAGSATQTPRFELTAVQTALLTRIGVGAYPFQVQVTWAADNPSQPAVHARGLVDTVKRLVVA